MNEIIKVNFENETVSARDLYESVNNGKKRFSKWFDRQLQYGFIEGEDYSKKYGVKKRENVLLKEKLKIMTCLLI